MNFNGTIIDDYYETPEPKTKTIKLITFTALQNKAYEITKSKGFYLQEHLKQLLLIGTEIQEAIETINIKPSTSVVLKKIQERFSQLMRDLETIRKSKLLKDHTTVLDVNHLQEELADIIIRVMSYEKELHKKYKLNLTLEQAIDKKLEYNKNRPKLHGKKF